MDDGASVVDGRAWRAFCERLAAVGDRILQDDFPSSPRDRAEGFRHLANQTIAWLSWAVGYPDARYPAFFRQNDLVVRSGGPNVDQTSRRARIDPAGTYRVTGEMGSCEDFILTVKDGDMYEEKYGILTEITAAELGIGPGDHFAVTLGPPGTDAGGGHLVTLHPDARLLNIREYYFAWEPRVPVTLAVERLDTQGTAPEPLTPEAFAVMLDDAASRVEHSLVYWNAWVRHECAELGTNALGPPKASAGGSENIAYGFGFFDLAPDEAWLVESDVPDADYYDFQLYSLGWFESLDFANRTTSLNHTQLTVSADGTIRVVVAHKDPGVPNWLDTEGRREAMLTYRWIKARTHPVARATVVKLTELAKHLPDDTPRVSPEMRAEEIRKRQAHIAWRYRT